MKIKDYNIIGKLFNLLEKIFYITNLDNYSTNHLFIRLNIDNDFIHCIQIDDYIKENDIKTTFSILIDMKNIKMLGSYFNNENIKLNITRILSKGAYINYTIEISKENNDIEKISLNNAIIVMQIAYKILYNIFKNKVSSITKIFDIVEYNFTKCKFNRVGKTICLTPVIVQPKKSFIVSRANHIKSVEIFNEMKLINHKQNKFYQKCNIVFMPSELFNLVEISMVKEINKTYTKYFVSGLRLKSTDGNSEEFKVSKENEEIILKEVLGYVEHLF